MSIITLYACQQEKKHLISGEINTPSFIKYIYLLEPDTTQKTKGFKIIDSSKINNHTFYFDYNLQKKSKLITLGFKPSYSNNDLHFYNENDSHLYKTLLLTPQGINLKAGINFSEVEFKDSINLNYDKLLKKLDQLSLQNNEEYKKIINSYSKNQNNNTNEKIYLLESKINTEKIELLKTYIEKNSGNPMSLFAFDSYLFPLLQKKSKEDIQMLERMLNSFNEYANLPVYRNLKYNIQKYKNCAIGGVFPDLEGINTEDQLENLSSYKGNYVLLDFWFKNCKPCALEVPYLKQVHEKYKNKGLKVISYSIDSGNFWKQTVKAEKEMIWHHLSIPNNEYLNPMTNRLCIEAFPTIYLLSPEGVVLENNLSQETILKAVSNYF
ncbi:peroxiredoxin family protein [Tenacibaculum sp. TC6]|uniref:peroxiredoxin family protein n=1 Tax=Tenacibaculum sp. TC6 TaxID=3423223 RepID=UPI003D3665FF